MIEEQRLEHQLDELRRQWRLLHESITKLKSHRILETRPDEQDRLSAIIGGKEIDLGKIEEELSPLEAQYDRLKAQALIQDVRRMERNNAFAEAMDVWEQIRALNATELDIDAEVQRPGTRREMTQTIGERIKQLTRRISEIGPVFREVVEGLKRPGLDPEGPVLDAVDSFLRHELSAGDFLQAWPALSGLAGSRNADGPNYLALAGRLKRGEIVLFLGPDISCLYDTPHYDAIVTTLAKQANYPGFSGSLATLGEYYHIQTDYGRRSLVDNLRGILHSARP